MKNACYLANKFVFYYGFSDLGVTNFSRAPYSTDFAVGANRPRKVVSTEAMDELADWPTRNEDFRFDPLDPSDITWHRWVGGWCRGTAAGARAQLGLQCREVRPGWAKRNVTDGRCVGRQLYAEGGAPQACMHLLAQGSPAMLTVHQRALTF